METESEKKQTKQKQKQTKNPEGIKYYAHVFFLQHYQIKENNCWLT